MRHFQILINLSIAVALAAPSFGLAQTCAESLEKIAIDFTPNKQPELEKLISEFPVEFERARLVSARYDTSKVYFLSYANESADTPREYLGNLLYAFKIHQQEVFAFVKAFVKNPKFKPSKPPKNGIINAVGLKIIEGNLVRSCEDACPHESPSRLKALAEDYFKVFDLRGAKQGFSGLPFFKLTIGKLKDPVFQSRVIELHQKLSDIITRYALEKEYNIRSNIFDLATEVNLGNRRAAVEMLGILLSRDTSMPKYLQYVKIADPRFAQALGELAAQVRLVSELDRVSRNSNLDRFSYDGSYSTQNVKHYYFWSAALAAVQMADLGYSKAEIRQISMQMPRQYKIFRIAEKYLYPMAFAVPEGSALALVAKSHQHTLTTSLAMGGVVAGAIYGQEMLVQTQLKSSVLRQDAIEVMRNSTEGAMRALDAVQKYQLTFGVSPVQN